MKILTNTDTILTGLDLSGDDPLGLDNFGRISANGVALVASAALTLNNYGSIAGAALDEVAVQLGSAADTVSNIGSIVGNALTGSGADRFTNGGTLIGALDLGDGADTLTNPGTIEQDVRAGNGDDTVVNTGTIRGFVEMGAGDDACDNRLGVIYGFVRMGTGDDTFQPGTGIERVDGGSGRDTLDFSRGPGVTLAFNHQFPAAGYAARDVYSGFENIIGSLTGANRLVADSLDNTLTGGNSADRLSGLGGTDRLYGGGGKDVLDGGRGDDFLYGGDGADVLTGGGGKDWLEGGRGADRFVFNRGDIRAPRDLKDVIVDFAPSQGDVIDLSSIDANRRQGGNQAFTFIGNAKFSDTAGELRWYDGAGDNKDLVTWLVGDTDGDGNADIAIQLLGDVHLRAVDIVL